MNLLPGLFLLTMLDAPFPPDKYSVQTSRMMIVEQLECDPLKNRREKGNLALIIKLFIL